MTRRQCGTCGWLDGKHDRDCDVIKKAPNGTVRGYPASADQLPELCFADLDHKDGKVVVLGFQSVVGDGANCVALPLDVFRQLVARVSGEPVPGAVDAALRVMETRLRDLTTAVNENTHIAALSQAALDTFVRAIEQEREDPARCLECEGTGSTLAAGFNSVDAGARVPCAYCNGTGKAR